MDKTQAVIDFISQCPQIQSNPLFFNFLNAKDNVKGIVTQANDVSLHTPYIDGSVEKRYTFTIIDFRSLVYQALPKAEGLVSENVEDFLDVKAILDWVNEQADNENYPDFGEDCIIDKMQSTSDNPNLNGVDTNVAPALAKYSITIQIDYLDNSKKIWK